MVLNLYSFQKQFQDKIITKFRCNKKIQKSRNYLRFIFSFGLEIYGEVSWARLHRKRSGLEFGLEIDPYQKWAI